MHIAVFSNTLWSIINYRTPLIMDLLESGHEVTVLAPEDENLVRLKELPVQYIPIRNLKAKGRNGVSDIRLLVELRKIFKNNSFDYLLGYTIKPNVYSNIASRGLKQNNISTINGLGYTFQNENFLNKIVSALYQFSLKNAKNVVFQNIDDKTLFIKKGIIHESQSVLVNGSGIDTSVFSPKVIDRSGNQLRFIYCARLVKEKGINLYLKAAEEIKKRYPGITFIVYGIVADNPSAIDESELFDYHKQGVIEYKGKSNDINEVLNSADIAVMPSYYREGVPRFLLESLSKGLPIITTDSVGCKETVKHEENGLLIKPESLTSLVDALDKIVNMDISLLKSFGERSRKLAVEKFDVKKVNEQYLNILN